MLHRGAVASLENKDGGNSGRRNLVTRNNPGENHKVVCRHVVFCRFTFVLTRTVRQIPLCITCNACAVIKTL